MFGTILGLQDQNYLTMEDVLTKLSMESMQELRMAGMGLVPQYFGVSDLTDLKYL